MGNRKKVVFVDDDAGWREIVQNSLQEAGYDVVTAADATEALQVADTAEVGLFILDLNLSGESGLNLMKYLKHNHPGVPILLFTSMEHDDGSIRQMLDLGADQYVRKGAIEELLVTVGMHFTNVP